MLIGFWQEGNETKNNGECLSYYISYNKQT